MKSPAEQRRWLLLRRRGVFRRSGKYPLAIGQSHAAGAAGIGTVLGKSPLNVNQIALFQGVPGPALPAQGVRRPAFALPMDRLTAGVLDIDVEPDVRIHPIDFRDRALQLYCLRSVIFRRE